MIGMFKHRHLEKGVTSLIVVLFSTLLFAVVSIGFVQQMTVEQRESSENELSQGAYDSALAGVEDGKRVLQACINGDSDSCTAISESRCDTVAAAGFVNTSDGEVLIQSSGGSGTEYVQAYTCVKVTPDTNDYVREISNDQSIVIPLRTTSNFNQLSVSWFLQSNSTNTGGAVNLDASAGASGILPVMSAWPTDRPPILRLQLIQFAGGTNVDPASFDNNGNGHTVYLYPAGIGSNTADFAADGRRSGQLAASPIRCSDTFLGPGGYACRATVLLPNPIGGNAGNRVAYLRVTSIYGTAEVSIAPLQNGSSVAFDGVQPSIDSTGRAADVFRRVDARVEFTDSSVAYPRATVDITQDFCKAFVVGNSLSDFSDNCPTP